MARVAMRIKVTGYGRSKPGRPKADPPCPEPLCSKCRQMRVEPGNAKRGPHCVCTQGHQLGTAATCPDYRDASQMRPTLTGGTTGIPAR